MEGEYGMTREEEIRKQALKYGEPEYLLQTPNILGTQGFIQGAKWADSHPNLSEEEQVGLGGLGMMWQKQALIKKTCEWLDNVNTDYYMDSGVFQINDLILDLRKYLEE